MFRSLVYPGLVGLALTLAISATCSVCSNVTVPPVSTPVGPTRAIAPRVATGLGLTARGSTHSFAPSGFPYTTDLLGPAVSVEAGLPFRAFQAGPPGDTGLWELTEHSDGILVPTGRSADEGYGATAIHRVVPLKPIWLGLLADTALFGSLLALAVRGVKVWRVQVRHNRKCCPDCGQPLLAGQPSCPECGHCKAG